MRASVLLASLVPSGVRRPAIAMPCRGPRCPAARPVHRGRWPRKTSPPALPRRPRRKAGLHGRAVPPSYRPCSKCRAAYVSALREVPLCLPGVPCRRLPTPLPWVCPTRCRRQGRRRRPLRRIGRGPDPYVEAECPVALRARPATPHEAESPHRRSPPRERRQLRILKRSPRDEAGPLAVGRGPPPRTSTATSGTVGAD